MKEYILITKFYNGEAQLPRLIENIRSQTVKPKIFVFLNDGSMDRSAEIVAQEATKHGLDFRIISMPVKKKGNLDTLGRIWTRAQPLLKELSKDVEYFATIDVDTTLAPAYFQYMIDYLERHQSIGVVAGQAIHEPKRTFPMFTGKVFRSAILRKINRYWDISADSFINVKALKMGYKLTILNVPVNTPATHLHTPKGKYRSGRLAYYSGTSLLYVLAKGVLKLNAQYLRGYWSEWTRGTWICTDSEIREYYGDEFKRRIISFVRRALSL